MSTISKRPHDSLRLKVSSRWNRQQPGRRLSLQLEDHVVNAVSADTQRQSKEVRPTQIFAYEGLGLVELYDSVILRS